MCGIAGFLHPAGQPGAEELLERMAARMVHRGPDAGGRYVTPDRRVGLCHRRLAILDLTPTGAQPMTDPEADLALSFNGEIFNYREISAELSSLGYRFRGTSDTEMILNAYRHWGISCVTRFIGMFAFALWDGKARTLFLVRDRLGIKPLYYYRGANAFLFGSELKPLLEHPDFPRHVDREALQYYLQFMYVPAPHSIFEGCHKLPPGHIATLIDGRCVEPRVVLERPRFLGKARRPTNRGGVPRGTRRPGPVLRAVPDDQRRAAGGVPLRGDRLLPRGRRHAIRVVPPRPHLLHRFPGKGVRRIALRAPGGQTPGDGAPRGDLRPIGGHPHHPAPAGVL